MYFLIASLVLGLSCSVITIKTLVGYSGMNLWLKLLVSALVLTGWFGHIGLSFIRRHELLGGSLMTVLSNAVYFLFGFMFLLFCLLMFRDILWFAASALAKLFHYQPQWLDPKNPVSLNFANLATVVICLGLSAYAVFEAVRLPRLQEIVYTSPKVTRETRFVVLNDMHITRNSSKKIVEKIVDFTNSLKPDAVLMVGDIIDDKLPAIEEKVSLLQNIKAPLGVYAASGNHEFYAGINAWYLKFKKMGIKVLVNEGSPIRNRNIYVAGIPDLTTASTGKFFAINYEQANKGSLRSDYKILLSHNPNPDLTGQNYDLQLSAHTHGGQIFPFHFAVDYVNQYLAGKYKVGKTDLYVSRGAGYWGPAMRLFAPSEITLLTIKPKSKTDEP